MKKLPKNKQSSQGTKKSSKTKLVLAPLVDFGRPQVLKEPSHPSLIAFKRNSERPPTPYDDIRTRKSIRTPETSSPPSSQASLYSMEARQTKRSSKIPPLAVEKHDHETDETRKQNGNTRASFLPKIEGNSRNSLTSQPQSNSRSTVVKLPPAGCRNVVAQGNYSRESRPASPSPGSLTNLELPSASSSKVARKRRTKSRRHIQSNLEYDDAEIAKKAKM
ncbi:Hypothetical predicted protein [Paramuricea clavata]|uniref:Uncharacterized protein n=1 Tax=Paramuricea clavata TaxID=317549 RepID=A0A7D9DBM4_PARCT|nr:Hypothetical predicted protein [Paramuricea clavata]